MKFCERHWGMLHKEVEDKGLTQFVAPTGEEAFKRMTADLDNKEFTRSTFDPLMGAHNAIMSNVLGAVGLGIFNETEDLQHCPLCFAQTEHDDNCQMSGCNQNFDNWIKKAVEDQMEIAKSLGLLGAS